MIKFVFKRFLLLLAVVVHFSRLYWSNFNLFFYTITCIKHSLALIRFVTKPLLFTRIHRDIKLIVSFKRFRV